MTERRTLIDILVHGREEEDRQETNTVVDILNPEQ